MIRGTVKISDLPRDLESEILSRVPTKSLSELKTTCKRWYALLKDPKFVKKNLGNCKSAREVIFLMNFSVYSISLNLHGIRNSVVDPPSMEFRGKLISLMDSTKDLRRSEVFHCDGLILCATEGNTRLVVWNPCTGETRWIKPSTCYKSCDNFALGYGNNNKNDESSFNSYKILRFCCYYFNNDSKHQIAEFEIYEFSSDSWRVIDDVVPNWSLSSLGVSLKGNGYWIAFDKETGFFMLKFDFETERFESLPLPFQSQDREDTAVLSVVREERISVLHQKLNAYSLEMKIWVTTKDVSSWSEFLVVDFGKFMLPRVMNVISYLLDEENKVAVCCDTDMEDEYRTRIYIVGEDVHKQVFKEITKGSISNWPLLLSYVPSLVHMQKDIPKEGRRRTRRFVKRN